jgi:hypothetical protein
MRDAVLAVEGGDILVSSENESSPTAKSFVLSRNIGTRYGSQVTVNLGSSEVACAIMPADARDS